MTLVAKRDITPDDMAKAVMGVTEHALANLNEALGLVDMRLVLCGDGTREVWSNQEMVDLLLDLRQALTT